MNKTQCIYFEDKTGDGLTSLIDHWLRADQDEADLKIIHCNYQVFTTAWTWDNPPNHIFSALIFYQFK